MVLNGNMDSAIADSGATSSCGKEAIPECGRYRLTVPLLIITGLPSNEMFQYARGSMG